MNDNVGIITDEDGYIRSVSDNVLDYFGMDKYEFQDKYIGDFLTNYDLLRAIFNADSGEKQEISAVMEVSGKKYFSN